MNLLAVQAGHGQAGMLMDVPFGPVLFLVDPVDGVLPANLPPTAVVHARLDEPDSSHYVASGSAADLATLQAEGVTARLLDADTAGKVYYLADARAENALALAAQAGDVLFAGQTTLLIATTPAGELALLESLPVQDVSISLLTSAPLLEEAADEGQLAAAALQAPAAVDPAVAALLPKLTEADLQTLVERLSGRAPAMVSGAPVTIDTRYTLAARLRDAEQFVYEYYVGLGMNVAYFNWTYGSYSGRNVIAEVRGTANPERVLLVGGHLDSMSQIPYTSAPGADDNATGTAATLLIARLLRDYRPAVTVRFVHFTGEEQGQWGSKVYAATLRQRGEQVIGFIDLDMIGWDGNGDRVVEIHTGSGPKSNALATSFLERNDRYGLGLTFERKSTTASRFSDHSPFWDNDIAAFLVIENFFTDTLARDRNPYYHNTGDLSDRVNFNYVARVGRLALAAVAELAGYNLGGPAPTPTPMPSPTPTPDPGNCTNLLLNGDFETTGGWQFGSTPFPAGYTTSIVFKGSRAGRLGIPAGSTNKLAHSSAFQKVTIPATAPTPVMLRFVQQSGGAADGIDYREVLLLNSSYGYLARLDRSYAAGNNQWVERAYDLTSYRGTTLVIYFNAYNNGANAQMWSYVDAVSLGDCPKPMGATAAVEDPAAVATVTPTITTTAPITVSTAVTTASRLVVTPDVVYLGDLAGTDQITVSVASASEGMNLPWRAATDVDRLQLEAVSNETPGSLGIGLVDAQFGTGVFTATVQLASTTAPTQTIAVWAYRGPVWRVFLPVISISDEGRGEGRGAIIEAGVSRLIAGGDQKSPATRPEIFVWRRGRDLNPRGH